MARYATSAPSRLSFGTDGSSSSSTASNTPMPPGTLLITPAAMAIRYTPANASKLIAACGGSNTYSTLAAHNKSAHATAICANAMRGFGTGMTMRQIFRGSCRVQTSHR